MPDESQIQKLIADHPYDRISDVPAFVAHMGAAIHQSGFFGCCNEAQGRVIALDCLVRKIPPLERAATDHIIEGKLSMRSDAMLAEFQKRGGKVKWENVGDDGQEAKAKFTTRDNAHLLITYTIEMARTAGLIKDKPGSNWRKNPGEMLRARLISKAVRMLDPEVVAGRYTPEELDPDSREAHSEAAYVPIANTEGTKAIEFPDMRNPNPAFDANGNREPTPLPVEKLEKLNADLKAAGAEPGIPANAPPSTQPAASVAPAPTVPTLDAATGEEMVTVAQLGQLKQLKTELAIPDEKWKATLAKPEYGVTTAKNLTAKKADVLITKMRKLLDDRQMNAWANKVQGVEQPPFEGGSPTQQT